MTDWKARAVEMRSPLGNLDRGLRKFIVPERRAIDGESRTIEFVVSSAARDRDGDMVDQAGWKLDAFRRNPVVLWAHDSSQPPVGRAESIEVRDGALRAVTRFADRETYAFADTVFRLYQGGFLSAVSAGFMPTRWEESRDEAGRPGYRFLEQELWEFSAVPIPSNPEALVAAKAAGIPERDMRDMVERALDERQVDGNERQLLSAAFVRLTGKVAPAVQRELAAKNGLTGEERPEAVMPPKTEAPAGTSLTTGPGGEDGHAHGLTLGETMTEEAGDPPHSHAVGYDEDGTAMVEQAEGHGHELSGDARLDPPEDEEDGAKPDEDMDEMKAALAELRAEVAALKAARAEPHAPPAEPRVKVTPEFAAAVAQMVGAAVSQELRRMAGRVD